jgi:hypothetical protein
MNHFLSTLEERTRALRATATPTLASAASALQQGAKQAGALLAETVERASAAAATAAAAAATAAATASNGGTHELAAVGAGSSGLLGYPAWTATAAAAPSARPEQQQQQQPENDADDADNDPLTLHHRLFARPPPPADAAAADEGSRAHRVRMVLVSPGPIDLAALRRGAQQPGGLPARDGLRAVAWRLLLGYLPATSTADDWDGELAKRRQDYRRFCDDLIVDPTATAAAAEEGGGEQPPSSVATAPAADVDHPLSTQSTSKWAEFFRDGEVLAQIRRDVARTHPESDFLGEGGGAAAARRRSEVARGLFVFAKLNPGVRYVQGMNELFAVLYWVFFCAEGESAAAASEEKATAAGTAPSSAEADAFWCFVALLSGPARDLFCASLDNDGAVGVRAVCSRLARALRGRDPRLASHLLDEGSTGGLGIDPRFFAFRWVTLMLSREFALADVLEVWDAALACGGGGGLGVAGGGGGMLGGGQEQGAAGAAAAAGQSAEEDQGEARLCFFLRMSLAMLAAVRERLLAADFGQSIKLLQQYPPDVSVRGLVEAALRAPPVPP